MTERTQVSQALKLLLYKIVDCSDDVEYIGRDLILKIEIRTLYINTIQFSSSLDLYKTTRNHTFWAHMLAGLARFHI